MSLDHTNPSDTFWSRIDVGHPDACWDWLGPMCGDRGHLWFQGRREYSHRLAFRLFFDTEIPSGLFVCHACDRGRCCNPAHLWLGSHLENMADRDAKGRNNPPRGKDHYSKTRPERVLRGRDHGMAKITEADVPIIIARVASGEKQRVVGTDYGLTQSGVSLIVRRLKWSHVQLDQNAGTAFR